jgi:hypothetical protein
VHKYEVFKRLFSHYDPHFRRHPGSRPASVRDYLWLADCLAAIAERTKLLQPISTLLKLCDALCSTGQGYTSSDLELLGDVLRREQILVDRFR